MKKYAKIIDEVKGTVEVGLGSDINFYKSIGMESLDVDIGYDGNWYLSNKLPVQSIDELKEQKIKQIDKETSDSILSGFDYTINNTKYHFSYDSFDQQNFADTANMCQLALSGVEGLPKTVTWNSYLEDGTLVQQEFDAQSFLKLYTTGAMVHKATQMEIGGQRKAKVAEAQSEEELDKI